LPDLSGVLATMLNKLSNYIHPELLLQSTTIKQRKTYAETILGEAKNSHGLRRAICRGLDKVTIQALLTSTVQNIKRLVKHYQDKIKGKALLSSKQLCPYTKIQFAGVRYLKISVS
jgi:hypothetical protein